MSGTVVTGKVERVVDGDTVRVFLEEGADRAESLRILALDTEEVRRGSKPETPLGHRASERAKELLSPGDEVRLTLPGPEPREEAMRRHRGNFGRLLVYLDLPDGRDFQEVMIREGLSPYFTKYGYAHFAARHARYREAERAAQAERLGVWDQVANNGAVMRNYAALGVWWDLRARIVEGFREIRRRAPTAPLFDTRTDHDRLLELARDRQETTVFMELREFRRIPGGHVVFRTGSEAQPFDLFIRNAADGGAEEIMNLLLSRYVAGGEAEPRRSYAYVTGMVKTFPEGPGGRPEIAVTDAAQISDWPHGLLERALGAANGPT